MATGYEDLDNMMNEQRNNLSEQEKLQSQIVDKGLEKVQNETNRQKEELDREATKTAKSLYTDYKKQSNPYSANAEQLASSGLANSGYAESSQVNLYNTYQKNVTEVINNTTRLKAEADFNMNQAYLDADIQKAQNALSIYQQKAELAMQEYQLKYQRDRDKITDEQWERQFAFQQQQANLSQSNWEREYQLSLQNRRSS